MKAEIFIHLVDFFNNLKITEEDVTTAQEKDEGALVVKACYSYKGKKYYTKKLYYKNIKQQDYVKDPETIISFFGGPVYWLDNHIHEWPKGKGKAELEKTVISEMIEEGDGEFFDFLKKLANNSKNGYIQEITYEGRSQQYGFNLENNNHWHDLINLIKEIINNRGGELDNKYFNRLVFNWQNDERASLHPNFGGRKIIHDLKKNINNMQEELNKKEIINLLNLKKQIILQGPPGTGKTKMAKELANQLTKIDDLIEIDKLEITDILVPGTRIGPSNRIGEFIVTGHSRNIDIRILSTGVQWEIPYDDLISCLKYGVDNKINKEVAYKPFLIASSEFIKHRLSERRVKLVQFHPSYSYEDFVRGITTEDLDGKVNYVTKNKILASFAEEARKNLIDSKKEKKVLSREKWVNAMMLEFADYIRLKLEQESKVLIGDTTTYIVDVSEDAFRYKGDNWLMHPRGLRMKFSQLADLYSKGVETRQEIINNTNFSGLTRQHASYFIKVLQAFKQFLESKPPLEEPETEVRRENFVLIIDEINRANLPVVFGELIYALEYRGKAVETIYEVEDSNKLILPPNLYIIGTMNTADRSVGHIDYAIRRRFAFVNVHPKILGEFSDQGKHLFKKVAKLFFEDYESTSSGHANSKYLTPDFKPLDIMLGHSYFLVKDEDRENNASSDEEILKIKLEYEIKPILREYIKDGILTEEARQIVEDLKVA